MGTLHVNKPGNGAAPIKGQQPAAAPKSRIPDAKPDAKPGNHVCTDACTHDGAVKGKPAPTAAKVG